MSLVLFRRCGTAMEVDIIHAKLEAAGIHSMIQRAGIPGAGTFVQSAEVFVEEAQVEQARCVLEDGGV